MPKCELCGHYSDSRVGFRFFPVKDLDDGTILVLYCADCAFANCGFSKRRSVGENDV